MYVCMYIFSSVVVDKSRVRVKGHTIFFQRRKNVSENRAFSIVVRVRVLVKIMFVTFMASIRFSLTNEELKISVTCHYSKSTIFA